MHITTKALVLRGVDYKESDKILTLLTQEQGKLTASARGCRKKGSAIAAGCQLLAWAEVVLYDYQGRWSVKEAAVERLFQGVRDDIERLALGCYFAEVAELLAVEEATCEVVENGQLAVERFAAALGDAFTGEERSAADLGREAHTLVSMAGMLGCDALCAACRALEYGAKQGGDVAPLLAEARRLRDETLEALAVGGEGRASQSA